MMKCCRPSMKFPPASVGIGSKLHEPRTASPVAAWLRPCTLCHWGDSFARLMASLTLRGCSKRCAKGIPMPEQNSLRSTLYELEIQRLWLRSRPVRGDPAAVYWGWRQLEFPASEPRQLPVRGEDQVPVVTPGDPWASPWSHRPGPSPRPDD